MARTTSREARTDELGSRDLDRILELCRAAWPDGEFTDADFRHALGGRHFLARSAGRLVGHVAVVPRTLELDGRPLHAGYAEAVATLPEFRQRGVASRLLEAAGVHIAAEYELGALSTDIPGLYERLGWRRWVGETWVGELDGTLTRTADEDAGILVLPTPRNPKVNLRGRLTCDWRPGDVW